MSEAPTVPARHALRAATQAVHERLHHLPAFAALAAGTVSREAYIALLGRLYGFHKPLEAELASALDPTPDGLDPKMWRRAHLLQQDLETLDADAGEFAQLAALPARLSREAAIGSLYVLVGSTLGGRMLARQLGGILPGDSQAGRTFLLRSLQPDHVRWARLCNVLDEYGAEAGARAEMVDSAIRTFVQFETWFSEPP